MSSATTCSRTNALAMLGFPAGSTPSEAEIKKAFHKAALKAHPDKPGGSSEAFGALTTAYELLTNPSETSSTQEYTTFDDLIADVIRRFGAENVTVTQTSAAHASASPCNKVTCPTCKKQHRGPCRYAAPAAASPGDKVTCPTCKKQHRGPCRYAAPAAASPGDKVTCPTCKKQHRGPCRYAKTA